MLTISLREFMLHGSRYLEKLPITLTQYNLPVAIVTPAHSDEVVPEKTEVKKKAPISETAGEKNIETHQLKFSQSKKEGYHFSPTIGSYVKD